ncbi:MAG: alpha-glucan family phosphorylase [Gemmatimonadota bacterium]
MADLPHQLSELSFLARNLRWSWHAETRALFERLDPALWAAARHNPVLLLERIDPICLQIVANDDRYVSSVQQCATDLREYLTTDHTWYRTSTPNNGLQIAYFSAEFAITEALPIFSGGLGVLAGDHLKSASDLGVPLVAITLMYREGYFNQRVDREGRQHEMYDPADPRLLPLTLERDQNGEPLEVTVPMLDRQARAQIWRADVGRVKLYLLDTDLEGNHPGDRRITDRLYGGDNEHRLRQEIVLGIGGMRALEALAIKPSVVHLNEGHASFAAVELIRQSLPKFENGAFFNAARTLSQHMVFTTHTPVPAGHDMFPAHIMERYLGGYIWEMRESWRRFLALGRHDATDDDEPFNMTLLALRLSGRRNGVSKLHGEVSRKMWHGVWPGVTEEETPIRSITNGVHLPTWVAPTMARVYAEHIAPDWANRWDAQTWQRAREIPARVLWNVRHELRERLVLHTRHVLAHQLVRRGEPANMAEHALDPEALTIVFARRFATYKRATLLLSDPQRLATLLKDNRIQFVFAGKAHPKDEPGKDLLKHIYQFGIESGLRDRFLFVEEYDVWLAHYLVSGADVWLNVPRRPFEASGTSGMKAAANGALNLSIPDGWWAEAWDEHNDDQHPIGWSIATPHVGEGQDRADAEALFTLLEQKVVPLFAERDGAGVPNGWCERMRSSIQKVVPYFNTHRMVGEYASEAYLPAHKANGSQ